jgi:formylglycine-generating enzyme required for sulfatase activity
MRMYTSTLRSRRQFRSTLLLLSVLPCACSDLSPEQSAVPRQATETLRADESEASPKTPGSVVWIREATRTPIEFRLIEGGMFRMGDDDYFARQGTIEYIVKGARIAVNEGPERRATVQAFYFAVHQITVSQYCDFLNASDRVDELVAMNQFAPFQRNDDGRWIPAVPSYYRTRPDLVVDEREVGQWPARCVTFMGATRFCEWLSERSGRRIRLPTEAEWEFAARGTESRAYPWGDKYDRDAPSDFFVGVIPSPIEDLPARNVTPDGIRGLATGGAGDWTASRYTNELGSDADRVADLASWLQGEPRTLRGRKSVTSREGLTRGAIEESVGFTGLRPVIELSVIGDIDDSPTAP